MTGVLIAFIIFVLFPGIILGFILLSRYLRYRETQTMIEHGLTPPPPQPIIPVMPPAMPPAMRPQPPPMTQAPWVAPMPPPTNQMAPRMPAMPPPMPMPAPVPPRQSRAQLTWGLILVGVGLALTLALWPIGWIANSAAGPSGAHFPLGLGPWMLGGFIPLFVGLALILAHVIGQPERNGSVAPPPPYASGGPYAPAPLAPPPPVYSPPAMPAPEAMGVQPAAPPVQPATEPITASDIAREQEETAPPT